MGSIQLINCMRKCISRLGRRDRASAILSSFVVKNVNDVFLRYLVQSASCAVPLRIGPLQTTSRASQPPPPGDKKREVVIYVRGIRCNHDLWEGARRKSAGTKNSDGRTTRERIKWYRRIRHIIRSEYDFLRQFFNRFLTIFQLSCRRNIPSTFIQRIKRINGDIFICI